MPARRKPPAGFRPLTRLSPFRKLVGPLYERLDDGGCAMGLYVAAKHGNMTNHVHGGMLAMLADSSIGLAFQHAAPHIRNMVTASLTVDYLGNAKVGDWIESRVHIHRIGRRMAFGTAIIWRDSEQIVRASGSFLILATH